MANITPSLLAYKTQNTYNNSGKIYVNGLCVKYHWTHFTFMWPRIITNFFLIKPTRSTNFPNLFRQKTLHVSGISFAHHQEFSTVNSELVYFMQIWWQLPSRVRMTLLGSCHKICMKYTSSEFTVENSWWWAKEMPETGRVFWQNKFGKLVRLVGFIKNKSLNPVIMKWSDTLFYQQLLTINAKTHHTIFSLTRINTPNINLKSFGI